MRKMKLWDTQKMQSQRSDLKFEFPAGLEELTSEETKSIFAGDSLSYWMGYVAGKIAHLFS
ncbi:MAG: hypothetical protein WDM78_22460 [Puia sp.]